MGSPNKKDTKKLVNLAIERGWAYEEGAHSHRLTHPRGDIVFVNKTASCPFALKNVKADINRVLRKHNEERIK